MKDLVVYGIISNRVTIENFVSNFNKVEYQKRLFFGFIEGIWYLDIIHHGERPGQVKKRAPGRPTNFIAVNCQLRSYS